MTKPRSSLAEPTVALSLGVLLVALVVFAMASGLLASPFNTSGSTLGPSPTSSSAAQASLRPSFGYPTPSPQPTFAAYLVQAGDTLTSIARAFETDTRSVALWNREAYPTLDPSSPNYDPDSIKPGWVLQILPGATADEETLPSSSPGLPTPSAPATPRPTASPRPTTSPPSPTPSSSIEPATVVRHGWRSSGEIGLTFDMGGRLTPALDIVNWLIDHDVAATIFPTGEMGTTDTGRAVLALVAAHPELFDLGNHSWDHPYFTKLTAAEMAWQLQQTEAAIKPLAGQTTKPWFRPPYGAVNEAVEVGVAAAGWSTIVKWDVDTIDWKRVVDGGPTADDIVAKITSDAQGGSIVLMHLGGYHTLDALPGILAAIDSKNLQPVTLKELFTQ